MVGRLVWQFVSQILLISSFSRNKQPSAGGTAFPEKALTFTKWGVWPVLLCPVPTPEHLFQSYGATFILHYAVRLAEVTG